MIWYDMFWYDMIYYIKLGAKIYSYRKIIQYVPNEKLYLNCNKERITIQLEFWNNIFFTNLTGVNNYKKKTTWCTYRNKKSGLQCVFINKIVIIWCI